MLFDKSIHAAGVGFHQRVGFLVHRIEIAFGGAGKAKGTELFVGFKAERADDFRKLAARSSAHQIQLPEAVLGHDIALSFDGVFEGGRADVRDTPIVAVDGDLLLQAGEEDRAVELRKRAIDEPPGCGARDNGNNQKCPDEETKDGPQAISRALEVKLQFRRRAPEAQPSGCDGAGALVGCDNLRRHCR